MADATAQHVLASLDYPGSRAGPHRGAGVQGPQPMPVKGGRVVSQLPRCSRARSRAAGAEAPEVVTVPGVQPSSRPSAGFSDSGSLPVSMH